MSFIRLSIADSDEDRSSVYHCDSHEGCSASSAADDDGCEAQSI